MQIYISGTDFETLSKHKPEEFKSASSYAADILRQKAEYLRSSETPEGKPIVPQYERP